MVGTLALCSQSHKQPAANPVLCNSQMKACPACNKACPNRKALRQHVKTAHSKHPSNSPERLMPPRKKNRALVASPPLPSPVQRSPGDETPRRKLDDRILELFGEHPTVTLGLDAPPSVPSPTVDDSPDPISPQHPSDPVPSPPGVPGDDSWTFTKEYQEHPDGTKTWRYTWVYHPAKEEESSLGGSPKFQLSPAS